MGEDFDKLITEDSRGLLHDFLGKDANTHYMPWSNIAQRKTSTLAALKLRDRGRNTT